MSNRDAFLERLDRISSDMPAGSIESSQQPARSASLSKATKRKEKYPIRLAWKAPLMRLVMGAFLLKALIFTGLGEAEYEQKHLAFLQGSSLDKAVAWVLQPDPLVRMVSDRAQMVTAEYTDKSSEVF